MDGAGRLPIPPRGASYVLNVITELSFAPVTFTHSRGGHRNDEAKRALIRPATTKAADHGYPPLAGLAGDGFARLTLLPVAAGFGGVDVAGLADLSGCAPCGLGALDPRGGREGLECGKRIGKERLGIRQAFGGDE